MKILKGDKKFKDMFYFFQIQIYQFQNYIIPQFVIILKDNE